MLMLLASVLSQTDRQLLNILLEPIKHDLHASDAQMGLLSGLYYVAFYVLASIPIAWMADRGSRRAIIAACVGTWSLATALSGTVSFYWQIATARAFAAAGEGGSSPAMYSLIADIFSQRARTRALAVISCGIAIGSGVGILVGGVLLEQLGWRGVFVVVSLAGFVLAPVIMWALPEPRRGQPVSAAPKASLFRTIATLWNIPTFRMLALAATCGGATGYGVLAWTPTFLTRVHGMSHAEVGVKLGVATAVGLLLGNLSSGYLADRLGQRDSRWSIWVASVGLLISVPVGLFSVFVGDGNLSVITLGLFSYFRAYWPPPVTACTISIADSRSQAVASACILFFISLGGAIGPFVMGSLNDSLNSAYGPSAVRYSVALAMSANAIGGVILLLTGPMLQRELLRKASAS